MVTRRERCVVDRIECGFIQATTAVDVRRSRGQAVAWSEERRHLGEGGGEYQFRRRR
jgi:hypothetical protein